MSAAEARDQDEATAFDVRPAIDDDRDFIMSTWLRAEGDNQAHVEGRLYVPWQRGMQLAILARPSTRVLVASPAGTPAIAGWAVLGPSTVYYVFVLPEARRVGVASMLLNSLRGAPVVLCGALPEGERKGRPRIRRPSHWRYVPRVNFLEAPEDR